MRRDLPDSFKRWLGMGGKVYFAHANQPGDRPAVIGYIRAFNRAGARRIAKLHGAAAGSLLRQADIIALKYTPELREIGAGESYRGNAPTKGVRSNPAEYKDIGEPHVVPGEGGWWIVQDATTYGGGAGEIVVAGPFPQESQARSLLPHAKPFGVHNGKLVAGVARPFDGSKRQSFPAVKKNPPLVVLGNPGHSRGAQILSKNIVSIRYQHAGDNDFYEHKFKRGSYIELLPDGSIRVYSPRGVKLWGDY